MRARGRFLCFVGAYLLELASIVAILRKKRLFLLLFLCCLLLVSCGRKKDAAMYDDPGRPAYGDMIITGSIGEPSNLIPILASDSSSHDIAGYVYNGLVKYDRNLNIVGSLAESWVISSDNLSITFKLR